MTLSRFLLLGWPGVWSTGTLSRGLTDVSSLLIWPSTPFHPARTWLADSTCSTDTSTTSRYESMMLKFVGFLSSKLRYIPCHISHHTLTYPFFTHLLFRCSLLSWFWPRPENIMFHDTSNEPNSPKTPASKKPGGPILAQQSTRWRKLERTWNKWKP